MRVRFQRFCMNLSKIRFTPAHAGNILSKAYEQYTLDLPTVQI